MPAFLSLDMDVTRPQRLDISREDLGKLILKHLPPELRNNIYDWVIFSDGGKVARQRLLLFNKMGQTIRDESASYFVMKSVFTIILPSKSTHNATLFAPIPDKYLRHLKRLQINVESGHVSEAFVRETARNVNALRYIRADFQELDIVIQKPSQISTFVNRRVDDSILGNNHPITIAIQNLLEARISKIIRIHCKEAWFATSVASYLKARFGPYLEFVGCSQYSVATSTVEKGFRGQLYTDMATYLGLSEDDMHNGGLEGSVSPLPSASSIRSSGVDFYSSTRFGSNSEGDDDEELDEEENDELSIFDQVEDVASLDTDTEMKADDDLDLDTDVDIENDLEPIEEGEVDAITANYEVARQQRKNNQEIDEMVVFSPHIL